MKYILFALGFMALGALLDRVSWLHAWEMYKAGKKEGQGLQDAPQSTQPTRQSVAINNRRSGQ